MDLTSGKEWTVVAISLNSNTLLGANADPSFQAIESGLDGNLLKTNTRAQSEPEDDMDVDHPDALDQDRPSPPPEVTSHQDTHLSKKEPSIGFSAHYFMFCLHSITNYFRPFFAS